MHGAELPYQALQFLLPHAPMGGRNVQEVPQFLELALWEGDCYRLGVNDLSEELLDALPVSFPGIELLYRHRVFGFPG